MNVVRPAEESDLAQIFDLASQAPAGLTTLPPDLGKLTEKVVETVKNIEFPPTGPRGESFLFVLESGDGKVVGTSAVYSKVGGFEPFWTYAIKSKVNRSATLELNHEVRYLEIKREHNGPSEIGTLYLDPQHRQHHAGRLLSLSRFLFVAEHREMFEDHILAELRGTIGKDGSAVFWDAIGAHFFGIPFTKADMLVNDDKSFIDDLMPKFPIYIDLLPKEAQMVIGAVAEETIPALRLLEQEGFSRIPEVDIFEGGPVVQCRTDAIRSVADSVSYNFAGIEDLAEMRTHLIANVSALKEFRCIASHGRVAGEEVYLSSEAAEALRLKKGDRVRISPLRIP